MSKRPGKMCKRMVLADERMEWREGRSEVDELSDEKKKENKANEENNDN